MRRKHVDRSSYNFHNTFSNASDKSSSKTWRSLLGLLTSRTVSDVRRQVTLHLWHELTLHFRETNLLLNVLISRGV